MEEGRRGAKGSRPGCGALLWLTAPNSCAPATTPRQTLAHKKRSESIPLQIAGKLPFRRLPSRERRSRVVMECQAGGSGPDRWLPPRLLQPGVGSWAALSPPVILMHLAHDASLQHFRPSRLTACADSLDLPARQAVCQSVPCVAAPAIRRGRCCRSRHASCRAASLVSSQRVCRLGLLLWLL